MKRYFVIFTIVLLSHLPKLINAQEYYFRFSEKDREKINTVVTRTVSIDKIEGDIIYAYANPLELDKLKGLGYQIDMLPHPTSLYRNRAMATTIEQMANWDKYPTYEVYRAMMKKFQQDYPTLCKLDSVGTTVQGRKLYVVKISDNVLENEEELEFFYTSTMHGDETTGFVLMLRLINYLLANYGTNDRVTNMVNNFAIYINPNANPDGTYYGGNHTVDGSRRANANGYDINRNFPDPRVGENPGGPYQPETLAMMEYAGSRNFVLSANYHGGIELVNFPWDAWTTSQNPHADHNWYYTISRQYADLAQANSPSGYFTGENNGVTQGGDWYVVSGGRQDYMNYWHHCRELTIEVSNAKNPNSSQLPNFWNYNIDAMLTFIERLNTGIKGTVKDNQGNPLAATITVQNHDKDNSHIITNPSNGVYIRMLEPGTWSLIYSCEGYISQVHTITVANYTSQITNNVVLLQAAQTSLSGTVTDSESNSPISGATIELLGTSMGSVTTNASGFYNFGSIPENTYQIKASKNGYLSQTVTQTLMGESNTVNFSLMPSSAESFETVVPQGFSFTGGNWTRDNSTAFDGTYSMKSAPISHNQQTAMLITLNISVPGEITFARKVSSESSYDFLKFYIDNDEKASWSGNQDWTQVTFPVTAGNHTFKWEYSKDGSVSNGSDCAWIDNIIFPMSTQTVTFNVTTSGNPVAGATISFSNQVVSTNNSGVAIFSGVPRGNSRPYSVNKANYVTAVGTVDIAYVNVNQYVELEPMQGDYSVTFTVSGTEGLLAGALVTLSGSSLTTDVNGQVVFLGLDLGTYPYAVEAVGYIPQEGTVVVDEDEVVEINLEPVPPVYNLTFLILDENNIPIEGAIVNMNGNVQTTNSQGYVYFTGLLEGDYYYTISSTGFLPIEGTIAVTSDSIVTVNLEPIVSNFDVTFIVVDIHESPIEGASILFDGDEMTTNHEGIAIFTEIIAGIHEFFVAADGYVSYQGNLIVNEDKIVTITLQFEPTPHAVTFIVSGLYDGVVNLLEGASVSLNGTTQITNNQGEAYFTGVLNETYNYVVSADGYFAYNGTVTILQDTVINVILNQYVETYSVTFVVVDNQEQPVENAYVTMNDLTLETNSQGIAQFNGIEEGEYSYQVIAEGFINHEGVVLILEDTTILVTMIYEPMVYSLAFTVTTYQGVAIEAATININDTVVATDTNGVAILSLVEGLYNYTISADGFISVDGTVQLLSDTSIEVSLSPETIYYVLTFFVYDKQLNALEGAIVHLNGSQTTTDELGKAIFPNLVEGWYPYAVEAEGFHAEAQTVFIESDSVFNVYLIPLSSPYMNNEIGTFNLWPNPFKNFINIGISLSEQVDLKIEIYTITGQKIAILANAVFEKGTHEIEWLGTNSNGEKISGGVYIVKFQYGNRLISRRVIFNP